VRTQLRRVSPEAILGGQKRIEGIFIPGVVEVVPKFDHGL
jgi:hypothetical protein